MSKRINLVLDDDVLALLEKWRESFGYDDLPATLRAVIRTYKLLSPVTQPVSEKKEEPKKIRKYTDEAIDKLINENNGKQQTTTYCPFHTSGLLCNCGCLKNEAAQEQFKIKLQQIYD